MKKSFLFVSLSMMLALGSCGGASNSADNNSSDNIGSSEENYTEVSDAVVDTEDNSETPEQVSKYPDWNPVGTYEMTDGYGNKYELVLKKGGNATLENLETRGVEGHEATSGTWRQDSEGYVECDFFAGPFIHIGENEYVMSPILTPDYFYVDSDAYKNDTDCIEVKKVS